MSEHTGMLALTACGMSHTAPHAEFPIMIFNMKSDVPAAPQVEKYSQFVIQFNVWAALRCDFHALTHGLNTKWIKAAAK